MLEEYHYYIPYQKIWVVACVTNGREYIELRTKDRENPERERVAWHAESNAGYGLSDLLYTDLNAMELQLPDLKNKIRAINEGGNADIQFNKMRGMKQYWLHQGPIFAPFVAAIERLLIAFENGRTLTSEEIEQMIIRYKDLKAMIQKLSDGFLAVKKENMVARYLGLHKKTPIQFPILSYGNVALQAMTIGGCRSSAYIDTCDVLPGMAAPDNGSADPLYCEAISTESPEELAAYLVNKYLAEGVRFRKCKYCGKYFGVTTKHNPDYCDRKVGATTKTCKEVGPLRLYEKRKLDNPAMRVYKRSYKAHNARVRYGIMTKEEFAKWSEEAREKRDLCVAGKLSLGELTEWLYQDKIKE